MTIFEKITFVFGTAIFIYLWNKYAVTRLIKSVTKSNPNNQWMYQNQETIIKIYQGFFWASLLLLIYNMIISN